MKHRETGEIYEGDIARKIAGIPWEIKGKIDPPKESKYRVFIQSMSSSRILEKGTLLIYKTSDDEPN